MGSSILLGIINSGIYKKDDILLYDSSEIVKEKFKEYRFAEKEKVLDENVEILIVAVKPQISSSKIKSSGCSAIIIA